jgi:hypothetical protein
MTDNLAFGELKQRFSILIKNEIRLYIFSLSKCSADTRTLKLRALVRKAKKRLLILRSLQSWLDSEDTRYFFNNYTTNALRLKTMEQQINEVQDGFYFTHSHLFAKRVQSLSVQFASAILSCRFNHLSLAIFSCGKLTSPKIELNFSRFVEELNLTIRLKVHLFDKIPSAVTSWKIQDGLLFLNKLNMYTLTLSLQYLSIDAPWAPIDFQLLVGQGNSGFVNDRHLEHSKMENQLLQFLKRKCNIAETAKNIFDSTTRISTSPNSTMSVNAVDITFNLDESCLLCQFVAEASILKTLSLQSLHFSKMLFWESRVEVDFVDDLSNNCVMTRFWRPYNMK